MYKTKNVNFKKKYFSLLRSLKAMEVKLICDKCPSKFLGRNCCGACNVLHNKVEELKKELENNGKEI